MALPRSPWVLALAILAATVAAGEPLRSSTGPNAADVERLVQQLGSDRYAEREAASKALAEIGEPAMKPLRKAASSDDAEVRRRAKQLLEDIPARLQAQVLAGLQGLGGRVRVSPYGGVGDVAIHVDLAHTKVGNADLGALALLRELHALNLSATNVSDAALVHVKNLDQLCTLRLSETKVTDAGLTELKGLRELTGLFLDRTAVTDAGLLHLKQLHLTFLDLSNTKVTDTGLVQLQTMSTLYRLDLCNTDVTDAGLDHLKGLTGLGWLGVSGTKVSPQGMAELRRALPRVLIDH
jgi:hypothetical protein